MTIIDHRPEAMITYVNQNTKSHIVNITLKQWLQPVKTDQATQETHCKHFTNMTITLKQWLQPVKTDQATQETHGKRYKHNHHLEKNDCNLSKHIKPHSERFTNMTAYNHWPSSEAEEAWPKINEHFDHNLTTSSILTFCDQNLLIEIKKQKMYRERPRKLPISFPS